MREKVKVPNLPPRGCDVIACLTGCTMFLEIFALLPLLYVVFKLLRKDSAPSHGVYARPGKWYHLKRFLFLLIHKLRCRKSRQAFGKIFQHDAYRYGLGYGKDIRGTPLKLDGAQQLKSCDNATDEVFFEGMDKDGNALVVRIGRREGGIAELWLLLNLKGVGFFQHPVHPDSVVFTAARNSFQAGGLSLDMVEPLRTWKISFNGLLRKNPSQEQSKSGDEFVHVKFSFLWNALSDTFSFPDEIPDIHLSDAVAKEKWSGKLWENLKKLSNNTFYDQAGEMRGTVLVEGEEPRKLRLKSLRSRFSGTKDWKSIHRYVSHYGYIEDGNFFNVSQWCLPNSTSSLLLGYLFTPNALFVPVTQSDLWLPLLGENQNPPDFWTLNFKAGGQTYNIEVKATKTVMLYQGEDWGNVIFEKLVEFTVNGKKGWGIAEFCYRCKDISPPTRQTPVPTFREPISLPEPDNRALVLPFTKEACKSSELVGGKGCQLAMLCTIKDKFIVPRGLCVTVRALQKQLESSTDIVDMWAELEDICSGKIKANIQECCKRLVDSFTAAQLCMDVQGSLVEALVKEFGTQHGEILFAVRSSAVGEDSDEMSAAGQMETFLGIKGIHKVFEAVMKCWASQCTYQAVEYRRQHGQPIKSLMGVVIQEMVQSEASGVLFTQDPLTANPGVITINANYGLGESVVSGIAEPDTITVSRSWDDKLSIKDKTIGSKKSVMSVAGSGGTQTTEVESAAAKQCCLPDDVILQLARIGIMIEKYFGDPRDIEWAVCNGQVYLLQARPITSFGLETEEELMHEFDAPLSYDQEWWTTCNIGEMMPGALTPLSMSTFLRAIDLGLQVMPVAAGIKPRFQPHLQKFTSSFCGRPLISLHNLAIMYQNHILGNDKKVSDLAILGRVLEDLTLQDLIQYNGESGLIGKVIHGIRMRKIQSASYDLMKLWEDRLKTYAFPECSTASDLYREIGSQMPDYIQCWTDGVINSGRSSTWSAVLMSVLTKGELEWKQEHYSDLAFLLAHCEKVYSADVPTALQHLAAVLSKSSQSKEIADMTTEDAVKWLQNDKGEPGKKFAKFMARHGHRCVREAEMLERSWRQQPEKVVSVIQSMMKAGIPEVTKRSIMSVSDSLAGIKCPTTWFGRLILKWALPRARAAVGDREWGKSLSVQMTDVFKEAYWALAELMVKEGRLPEPDLLFFLTHQEIGTLLKTRSGRLVAKANRRKRVLPKQMATEFPEFSIGHPEPIEEVTENDSVVTSVALKGLPVSQGVVRGTARVVTSLQEASQIQPGDILIVPYTDVGWSPYFPLISGLVTELGGLLSHGAVVAREYGLPCVVNIPKATHLFATGDQVVLNGTKGTLEKME